MVKSARARRTRRDGAAAPVLPEDLVLWEILYRLPAKELLRCRAVCRSWRRLTCDAEFLLAHHRHQPLLPLVSFSNDARSKAPATVDAFDLRQSPAVRRPILGFSNCFIHASCDGLLLLSRNNIRDKYYYICNPATRQWCTLPNVSYVAALYHHRPSGEYRVLYGKAHPNRPAGSVVYYVLTVGSSLEGQRSIRLTDTKLHAYNPPVVLHDCLHWYSVSENSLDIESKVLVFDTVDESFRCMQPPIDGYAARLRQADGTLCLHHLVRDTMIVEVWALQDYEMEVWSLKCKIQLPVWKRNKFGSYEDLRIWEVVSDCGDMLLCGRWSGLLLHCDSKGKLVDTFEDYLLDRGELRLSFKESLVRHAFFERKDCKRVEIPGFFRGL